MATAREIMHAGAECIGGNEYNGDGITDEAEEDCTGETTAPDGSPDTAGDGLPDHQDADDDGDGVVDEADEAPCDPNCQ